MAIVEAPIAATAAPLTDPAGQPPVARAQGLRQHMILLVIIALLPVGISTVIMVAGGVREARRHFGEQLSERATTVALALDRELEVVALALAVMATSRQGESTVSFDARAHAITEVLGNPLRRHDPAQLTPTRLPGALLRALSTGRTAVGSGAIQPIEGGTGIAMYEPVMRDGAIVEVLEMDLAEVQISNVLAAQNRGAEGVALVLTPGGRINAAAGTGAPAIGQLAPDWLIHPAGPLPEGDWIDGSSRLCAIAVPARAPTWSTAVCAPRALFDASWQEPLREQALTALASLAVGIAAAIALAHRLAHPLARLTAQAREIVAGSDRGIDIPPLAVAEFEALRLGMRDAAAALRDRAAAEHLAMLDARTSQRLLASVLNGAEEGIHVKDLQGRYVMLNRAARRSFGFTEATELTGQRAVDILQPADATEIEALDRDVIETGATRAFEITRLRKDGPHHFALTKTPWRDATGGIAGVVTVSRDVTAARAAEARLRALQAELLRATRLSSMGAMASGLAHEINQPLAASTNYLNAAVRLLDRASTGEQGALSTARDAVSEAAAETLRAGNIVRRLRQFVDRGEAELAEEDAASLIAEAVALAAPEARAAGVRLVQHVPADIGLALVDRTQMQQVLLNLIRNATDAIETRPDGPGPDDKVILAARRDADGSLAMSVTDNGPGVAPEVAARLFEPFVSTKRGGMGIGLAICRTIVEGHGGTLRLLPPTASPTAGTTFEIRLPPPLLKAEAA